MDDLILAGALSVTGFYAAAVIAAIMVIFTLAELFSAFFTGDTGRVIAITGIILLFLALYAGTGLWLQKRDYI